MIEYHIVETNTKEAMIDEIGNFLLSDWECQGGICYDETLRSRYLQAMIKEQVEP